MPGNDYAFLTHWRMEATPEEVYDVIADGWTPCAGPHSGAA